MNAQEVIRLLDLKPHPREDGFFVETYRSTDRISWEALPGSYSGDRCFSTAIYFMLVAGGFSEMHRVRSDELFHYYMGDPAEMLLLLPHGEGRIVRFGNHLEAGEVPQIVVPRNAWQGMLTTGEYTLFGNTVAPGFEYSDYESGNREELIGLYPQFAEKIAKLTR